VRVYVIVVVDTIVMTLPDAGSLTLRFNASEFAGLGVGEGSAGMMTTTMDEEEGDGDARADGDDDSEGTIGATGTLAPPPPAAGLAG